MNNKCYLVTWRPAYNYVNRYNATNYPKYHTRKTVKIVQFKTLSKESATLRMKFRF